MCDQECDLMEKIAALPRDNLPDNKLRAKASHSFSCPGPSPRTGISSDVMLPKRRISQGTEQGGQIKKTQLLSPARREVQPLTCTIPIGISAAKELLSWQMRLYLTPPYTCELLVI